MAEGFAYQGEVSPHSGKPRGEPSADLPTTAFVICLQNHDQIGNRAFGERLTQLADPAGAARRHGAAAALARSSRCCSWARNGARKTPFLFFTDHNDELAEAGARRPAARVQAFRRLRRPGAGARRSPTRTRRRPSTPRPRPARPSGRHAAIRALHAELLALRHRYIVPGIPGCRSEGARGARRRRRCVARWRLGNGALLTLAINLGDDAGADRPAHGRDAVRDRRER